MYMVAFNLVFFVPCFSCVIISTFRLMHRNADNHVTTNNDSHSSKEKDSYIERTAVLSISSEIHLKLCLAHPPKDRKISTTIKTLDPKDLRCIPVLFSTHPRLLKPTHHEWSSI